MYFTDKTVKTPLFFRSTHLPLIPNSRATNAKGEAHAREDAEGEGPGEQWHG